MNTLRTLALATTLAITSLVAVANEPAAPATPRVDQRQAKQEARIEQGVASGQLNARETRRLERQQTAIEKTEEKAKADGTVTAKERAQMHRQQDRASHNIRHQKHDRQVAR